MGPELGRFVLSCQEPNLSAEPQTWAQCMKPHRTAPSRLLLAEQCSNTELSSLPCSAPWLCAPPAPPPKTRGLRLPDAHSATAERCSEPAGLGASGTPQRCGSGAAQASQWGQELRGLAQPQRGAACRPAAGTIGSHHPRDAEG